VSDKGVGYAAIAAGGILAYSGVRGYSLLKAVQNITGGKAANTGQTTSLIGVPGTTGSVNNVGTLASDSEIATLAQTYIGKWSYVWGGAPGIMGGVGDCSSFVNFIVGAKLGLAIPLYKAGTYDGATHGPPTTTWIAWAGCATVPKAEASPGDIVVGPTHMGIYVGNGQYCSARDPAEGVGNDPVSEFPDPLVLYRRIRAA
jgi:cell wall-associated NlpC family hydrolase